MGRDDVLQRVHFVQSRRGCSGCRGDPNRASEVRKALVPPARSVDIPGPDRACSEPRAVAVDRRRDGRLGLPDRAVLALCGRVAVGRARDPSMGCDETEGPDPSRARCGRARVVGRARRLRSRSVVRGAPGAHAGIHRGAVVRRHARGRERGTRLAAEIPRRHRPARGAPPQPRVGSARRRRRAPAPPHTAYRVGRCNRGLPAQHRDGCGRGGCSQQGGRSAAGGRGKGSYAEPGRP